MTLGDVARWVLTADEADLDMKTICVRKPWRSDSDAIVVPLDEESRLPKKALSRGHKYFLEASTAREVVEGLAGRPGVTDEDVCRLLIYYAENDAYPDWVYKYSR